MRILLLLLFSLLFAFTHAEGQHIQSYDGYKVLRIRLESQAQADYVSSRELDVWSRDGYAKVGAENDIMMKDEHIHDLRTLGAVHHSVLIEDVQQHLNGAQREHVGRRIIESTASPFFDAYHNYTEIIAYLKNLTASYPNLATLIGSIGSSVENRDIPAVQITGGKGTNKKNLFISGGQHAREWIAPATVLFILESLLTQYGSDAATTTLVDKFNIHVVPLVNPDGYAFTQTNRLWRKNRRHNSNGSYGVDLNRNWDEHWCKYGASTSPSSDTYCGTAPFSEPETKATSEYIAKFSFAAVIDFHSYGQLILRPYGYTTNPLPPNETLLKSVGDGMAAVIKNTTQKVYTSEHGADLYPASGAADDWSYVVGKVPLVFTLELRDTGSSGFQLPASQIIPTGTEAYAAFQYLSTRA